MKRIKYSQHNQTTTTYGIWKLLVNRISRSTLLAKTCNLSKFRYAFSSRNLWVQISCQRNNYLKLQNNCMYVLNISRFQGP